MIMSMHFFEKPFEIKCMQIVEMLGEIQIRVLIAISFYSSYMLTVAAGYKS